MQSALADMTNHFLTEKADRLSVFGQPLAVKNVQGCIFLTRWLQAALIPFVTTQSVRQNYTSVYSFDCKLWLCHNIATAWNNRHPWR